MWGPLLQLPLPCSFGWCLSLQAVQVNQWTRKLWAAVLAEFVGMAIFEIYGGNAPDSVAAYGNGITLGILGKHPFLLSLSRPVVVAPAINL